MDTLSLLDALCATLAELDALAEEGSEAAAKAVVAVTTQHPEALSEARHHAELREAFEAVEAPGMPWPQWAAGVRALRLGGRELAELGRGDARLEITDARWSLRRGERVHLGPAVR